MLTFGEGWHNNHHAHPTSARHGLRWYEVDFNWYGIWALKKLHLAKQIQRAKWNDRRMTEDILIPPPAGTHTTQSDLGLAS
jgi:stearoyl-CoA desaturase (delta-9 desaturase)